MPTVVAVKTGADPDVARYGLSDGSVFIVRRSYAPDDPRWAGLVPGTEPDGTDLAWLAEQAGRFAAERAALRLVARAEQCRSSLARKLASRGLADSRPALDRLEAAGLVDDRRYAAAWLEARLRRRPAGRGRLLLELRARGVDPDAAADVLAKRLDEAAELDCLRRWLDQAGLDPGRLDVRGRARLAAAGFSPAALRRLRDS